ncbi:peroxiredoxin [Candidatus Methylacidiphilum fumarolicum]|uniref:Peroxiredoxin family protein n=2 Tax=Candidatus Methylacidiphilum fumarolicum TaxID=591154 RepID=I0JYF4_METFB|nr:DsrE/DsrF/DrsH-like family protein [Candidatus Methylacidiphilum fumarolicum]MBW6414814.1 DsrE/DsrF/DrsH-like family protein [Candidatus Methylacidiphilum fumarolicum]TFE67347.1 peroxiredoxin [Candidatus Methylacidiphilum fumarolicum]TFE73324.1 peroxiredoxin [Candidatus Methylacidiphilum fumarolicum]TFE74105.1 peroxiredoxin [Candidatus Methylacidiphilum fumarolicum]TFE77045.1 peroxiredoxin [Candidatus Methylacidiphilum fumarolicum]
MEDKISIILFSGTVDKLLAVATIASGAAAMQKKVQIFVTFYGLLAFRKDAWKTNRRLSKDFEDFATEAMKAMEEKKVPSWLDTLKVAMEIGDVQVHACGLTMDLLAIKLEDLEPVVSDVVGVGTFVENASGGQILFI